MTVRQYFGVSSFGATMRDGEKLLFPSRNSSTFATGDFHGYALPDFRHGS
ncbi:MAG TPA: hypothetical protein PK156_34710 [Polyangium sp.]|nr:hypothetical protein [Polyangium sp.]